MKVWSVNSTQRATLSTSHSFEQNFYSYSEGLFAQFAQLVQFAQNHTDLLRKVAKIHTKSLKVAQICPKLHKVTQICPNYTLIEILLQKVRHEKCDPWSRQVWSNLQTKPLQLSICWYFAQKSATCKVWPTNYIELKN